MLLPSIHIIEFSLAAQGLSAFDLESLTGEKFLELHRGKKLPTYGDKILSNEEFTNNPEAKEFLENYFFEHDADITLFDSAINRMNSAIVKSIQDSKLSPVQANVLLPKDYADKVKIDEMEPLGINYDHCLHIAFNHYRDNNLSKQKDTSPKDKLTFYQVRGYVNGKAVVISSDNKTTHICRRMESGYLIPTIDFALHINFRDIDPAVLNEGQRNAIMGFGTQRPSSP